jgi:hypothetical protein
MAAKRITGLSTGTPTASHSIPIDIATGANTTTKATMGEVLAAFGIASYTVAGLPTVGINRMAFATNGRKVGEGSGAGTGVLCISTVAAWIAVDSGSTVAA